MHRLQCRQWKVGKIRAHQYPWNRVCTKPMFTSKGSYGYGEAKNAFALSVKITHWVLRTSKIYQVSCIAVYGRQWKFGKIRGYQYPWCRVCTNPMFISKGSYGYGEAKNAFALSVQITHWALRTSNLHHVSCIAYSAANGNLENFGATNTHGTVFALSRCLHQKESTGMEILKMLSLCRFK